MHKRDPAVGEKKGIDKSRTQNIRSAGQKNSFTGEQNPETQTRGTDIHHTCSYQPRPDAFFYLALGSSSDAARSDSGTVPESAPT